MSKIGFPLKDLARRKIQTALTVIALTLSVASTLFLVLLGQSLGFEIPFIAEAKLTTGFSHIFSGFIIAIILLNVIAGALTTYFLVSNLMSQRTGEIGIMKAVGCLTETAFGYFATELFIVVFTSCLAGTFLGVLMTHMCISFNILGVPIEQSSINFWTIMVVFLVFVLISHIFGVLPIVKTIQIGTAEALLPHYLREASFKSGKSRLSKLGFSFKIAYRKLMRRKPATLRTIVCLSAILTLTTIMFIGGTVANETTQSYLERAIGENIVLVSHTEIVEHYLNLLSPTSETNQAKSANYLNRKYHIPSEIVSNLNEVPGVLRVDARLVFMEIVHEIPEIVIVDQVYLEIGDHRSNKALIIGVNPGFLINKWLTFGRFFNKTDVNSVIVGDSLAAGILSDPISQSIRLYERDFQVVGVCLDPINNGDVVYIPIQGLSQLLQQTGYNLLLLKIDPANRSKVISAIRKEILNTELQLAELNVILEEHRTFFNSLWSAVMFSPLFGLVVATVCLTSYMMLCVKEQQREFGVMRALGAKPGTIVKIVLAESSFVTLIAGITSVPIGLFISLTFLIPESVISYQSLFTVIVVLLFAMSVLCLASLFPAYSIVKREIANFL